MSAVRPDSTQQQSLLCALDAWRTVIGHENVQTDEASLRCCEKATFATTQRVTAILRPADRPELQRVMQIAQRHRVPVYPVSGGRNWGMGSRVPPGDGCAVVDLGRLNHILDFSEELSYLTVEPGVTFAQAAAFLAERGSGLFLSVIGGPPDGSLIGNALERGDGLGPLGDRFAHSCAQEVVLPDGQCVRSGFSRFDQVHVAPLTRWGLGPSVDGLFSQSNLGIVTRMTFWLRLRPAHYQGFFFTLERGVDLPRMVSVLRGLQAGGVVLPYSLAIWNRFKALASSTQYPWSLAGGQTPLRTDLLKDMRLPWGDAEWIGVGALYGASRAHARADRKVVERSLRGVARRLTFIDERTAALAERFAMPLQRWLSWDVKERLDILYRRPVFLGCPTWRSLRSLYWRKKRAIPASIDPHRDGCGLFAVCVALPFSGPHVERANRAVHEVVAEYALEPNVAMVFPSERVVFFFPFLLYDREIPGEDEKARACHDALLERLIALGYPPYRLGIQSMDRAPSCNDDSARFLRTLKDAIDPGNVLAPGRYDVWR